MLGSLVPMAIEENQSNYTRLHDITVIVKSHTKINRSDGIIIGVTVNRYLGSYIKKKSRRYRARSKYDAININTTTKNVTFSVQPKQIMSIANSKSTGDHSQPVYLDR